MRAVQVRVDLLCWLQQSSAAASRAYLKRLHRKTQQCSLYSGPHCTKKMLKTTLSLNFRLRKKRSCGRTRAFLQSRDGVWRARFYASEAQFLIHTACMAVKSQRPLARPFQRISPVTSGRTRRPALRVKESPRPRPKERLNTLECFLPAHSPVCLQRISHSC